MSSKIERNTCSSFHCYPLFNSSYRYLSPNAISIQSAQDACMLKRDRLIAVYNINETIQTTLTKKYINKVYKFDIVIILLSQLNWINNQFNVIKLNVQNTNSALKPISHFFTLSFKPNPHYLTKNKFLQEKLDLEST